MTTLTFAQALILTKGYPEFRPDQPRSEDGRFAGGSGSGGQQWAEAMQRAADSLAREPTEARAKTFGSAVKRAIDATMEGLANAKPVGGLYEHDSPLWKKLLTVVANVVAAVGVAAASVAMRAPVAAAVLGTVIAIGWYVLQQWGHSREGRRAHNLARSQQAARGIWGDK